MAHRRGGLLWHRNFRLLWLGETVSGDGTAMAATGVPLLAVTVLRASTFAVAALTAAAYLPWLVIGLPAGAWVDRLPIRPLMITCDVVCAVPYASLPAAAWAGVLTTGQVAAAATAAGTAGVLFATGYQVLLPSLITAGELVEGNAKLQGGASAAAARPAWPPRRSAPPPRCCSTRPASWSRRPACCASRPAQPRRGPVISGVRALPRYRPRWPRACGSSPATPTAPAHHLRGRRQPRLHRQHGTAGGLPGPGGRIRPGRRRAAPGHGRHRRGARRRDRPAAGPVAGDRPGPAAERPGGRAVQPAHPAVRRGAAGGLLRGARSGGVGRDSGREHHRRELPAGLLSPAGARARHRQHALCRLRRHPARRAGRRGLATALGTRAALWVILACYALSGAFLATPAMLAHRDLPGGSPGRRDRTAGRGH
jgi:Transmembrane secretion effector